VLPRFERDAMGGGALLILFPGLCCAVVEALECAWLVLTFKLELVDG
jgi:hypothetical protein